MPCSHPRVCDHVSWRHRAESDEEKAGLIRRDVFGEWTYSSMGCSMNKEWKLREPGGYFRNIAKLLLIWPRCSREPLWLLEIKYQQMMPYLDWGGYGLEKWGVIFYFRAYIVPGTVNSLSHWYWYLNTNKYLSLWQRMQKLCPAGMLKMSRNGKSYCCHTAESYFFSRENS